MGEFDLRRSPSRYCDPKSNRKDTKKRMKLLAKAVPYLMVQAIMDLEYCNSDDIKEYSNGGCAICVIKVGHRGEVLPFFFEYKGKRTLSPDNGRDETLPSHLKGACPTHNYRLDQEGKLEVQMEIHWEPSLQPKDYTEFMETIRNIERIKATEIKFSQGRDKCMLERVWDLKTVKQHKFWVTLQNIQEAMDGEDQMEKFRNDEPGNETLQPVICVIDPNVFGDGRPGKPWIDPKSMKIMD